MFKQSFPSQYEWFNNLIKRIKTNIVAISGQGVKTLHFCFSILATYRVDKGPTTLQQLRKTQGIEPMLVQCWSTVYDAGATLTFRVCWGSGVRLRHLLLLTFISRDKIYPHMKSRRDMLDAFYIVTMLICKLFVCIAVNRTNNHSFLYGLNCLSIPNQSQILTLKALN